MWTAYFQPNGEHRWVIATCRFKHTAEFEAEKFIKRMSNPVALLYWVWVEETDANISDGNDTGGTGDGAGLPELGNSPTTKVDSSDGIQS